MIAFHGAALAVGGGWMAFGLVFYVVYRKLVERTSLTKRVTVPELSLKKRQIEAAEFSTILVPVFGTALDDDIIATAGRLADTQVEEHEHKPRLDVIYVAELPLTVPIEAPLPEAVREKADRALARANEIGDEYENVEVGTAFVRARSIGAGIVERGAPEECGGDRDGRRAADPGAGRRDPRRHRRGAPERGREGHRVRAQEGSVPCASHRTA